MHMRTLEFNSVSKGGVREYNTWAALQALPLPPDVCTSIFEYTDRPKNNMVVRLIASRLNPKVLRQAYGLDHTPAAADFDTVWDFVGKRLKERELAEHWHVALSR